MNHHKFIALNLAVLALPTMAAEPEDLYFANLPTVASVSRLQQPLSEAPGAVSVIDRDIIRASGARNLSDVLRLVPGFQVTPPNQEGAVVAYHGLSNEEYTPRVQVLIDGRSLYSPLFKSGVNWDLIPVALEDIERIEVMRGANGVSFGSNALMGVINIITQHASLSRGWTVSTATGSDSVRDQFLRWGGQIGAADVRFTVRQQGDGGLRRMFDNNLGWFDPHDSRHTKLLDLRADIPLTDRDELQVSLSHAYDVSQFGRPASLSDPFRDLTQSSNSLNVEWRRNISPTEEVKLRFSHTADWAAGQYMSGVSYNAFVPNSLSGKVVTYALAVVPGGNSSDDELEFVHTLVPGTDMRLAWGLGLARTGVSSQLQFYTSDWRHRTMARVFGNLEWRPLQSWLFNLGGAVQHDTLTDDIFDPRASASYHLSPDHTLRLVASRAHRSPSLYEALGDTRLVPISGASYPVDRAYLAAPNLKAERVDTLEAGYLGEFKNLRASVDVRAFRERIPNRIQIVPYALPASSADDRDALDERLAFNYPYGRADASLNLEHVLIRGFEHQWRWQPFSGTRLLYNHAYTSTYADLTDESPVIDKRNTPPSDTDNIGKISRQTRNSAPRHSTSAMLIQQLPYNAEASVMYYKSGFMRWARNSFTDPYERVDWRLAWKFNAGPTRGELAYVAQSANHPQEGRRNTRLVNEYHWLTLRLDF